MPFKRIDKCVYKTTKSGKQKEKKGCSDSVAMAKEYLKALYANSDDVSEQVNDFLNERATDNVYQDILAFFVRRVLKIENLRR